MLTGQAYAFLLHDGARVVGWVFLSGDVTIGCDPVRWGFLGRDYAAEIHFSCVSLGGKVKGGNPRIVNTSIRVSSIRVSFVPPNFLLLPKVKVVVVVAERFVPSRPSLFFL